jgi:hypothetical protein
MGTVENAAVCKQFDADPRAFTFTHFSSKFNEQSFNVTPLDATWDRARKNQLEGSVVLPMHGQ